VKQRGYLRYIILIMCLYVFLGPISVKAQSYIDTLTLIPLPPDTFMLERHGGSIVVRWYPVHDSLSAVIGTRDFSNWYTVGPEIPTVDIVGYYIGDIDRHIIIQKTKATVDTLGHDPSIRMLAEIQESKDVYRKVFDIGANYYTPGDTIDLILVGAKTGDTLDLGIGLVFSEGIIDTFPNGEVPSFEMDLQDFEGFHIWRGTSPYPSEMEIIADLSKEDAYRGIDEDSLYFLEWPRYDEQGRKYYEYVDKNVFPGFVYYYIVTTYDRGFFNGHTRHYKWDNYICEDGRLIQYYDPPNGEIIECKDAARKIEMTVDAGTDIKMVYAVPNPYRTGSSAETWPFYHNYPDMSIRLFNVPREADIKIYTVSGDLVWETHHSDPSGENGIVSWNTRNMNGEEVSSGVYIFKCESSDGKVVYGRIVIIR